MADPNLDELALIAICARRLTKRRIDAGDGEGAVIMANVGANMMHALGTDLGFSPDTIHARVEELLADGGALAKVH